MNKLFSLCLITFHFWAPLLCCCSGDGCVPNQGCEQAAVMAMDHCKSQKTSSHCAKKASETPSKKSPTQLKSCDCGKHQMTAPNFVLPTPENMVTKLSVTPVLPSWLASRQHISKGLGSVENRAPKLATARLAPRLSVLARFLI